MISRTILVYPLVLLLTATGGSALAAPGLTPEQKLGKFIFFDKHLSINKNQSCATCHAPSVGWTGPDEAINKGGAVYEGSIPNAFGDRKPPSSAYATLSPIFYMDKKGLFVGGNFWDGRATGEKLGNPAADQAQGPFLNPNEQALATPADVVSRVCNGDYGYLFRQVWGKKSCVSANVNMAYDQIALSIAAYEDSPEVNAFTSKWDYSFKGKAKLTNLERRGFALFQGKGQCKLCHVSNGQNAGHDHRLGHSNLQESQLAKVDSDAKEGAGRNDDQGQNALFTDFTFDNLGMPQNPENPAGVAPAFVDLGLGSFLKSAGYSKKVYSAEWGKHKVPTLRNVDLRPYPGFVKAYGHNGYFKSLEAIVHFYNTRDVLPRCENINSPQPGVNCWPAPEVPQNVNTAELGNLGLTPEEEAAIVAFLKTLSDGYKP